MLQNDKWDMFATEKSFIQDNSNISEQNQTHNSLKFAHLTVKSGIVNQK